MNCLALKKSNCKNCYKCIRNCPVKAIRFSGNQSHIISDDCILCGQCFVVCPQNAEQIVDEIEKVKVFLQSGDPVVVSLAPSFVAHYSGVGIHTIRKALLQLGFSAVEETAIGAVTVKREYERILQEENRDVVISSCCHSVNLLVQKYFPELIDCLAEVLSPMQVHCKQIKEEMPNAKTVFIGPCVAKKDEANHYDGLVDAVLTFEELSKWLHAEGIELELEPNNAEEEGLTRFFPTAGGILKTMENKPQGYTYLSVDGVENCMAALKDIAEGRLHRCFVEMSACVGSCIGGPVIRKHQQSSLAARYTAISDFAGKTDFAAEQPEKKDLLKHFRQIDRNKSVPTEIEIGAILRKMGKFKASQELNCGSCGYNTCREKAIAVYQGKAELSMCLPFLMGKAESFSDTIVSNSPNGFIVLNENLEVQQINAAAMKIMNIRYANDVLGAQVVRILDPTVFMKVRDTGENVHDQRVYLAEYKRFVEQSVVYDQESHLLVGFMHDVTDEEAERTKKENIRRQTIEVADKVVDKQMYIVQEIASLLGETAAETKIALAKLKESISDE